MAFRPRRLRRRIATPVTPICLINAAGWCTTHDGVHTAPRPRLSVANAFLYGGLHSALLALGTVTVLSQ